MSDRCVYIYTYIQIPGLPAAVYENKMGGGFFEVLDPGKSLQRPNKKKGVAIPSSFDWLCQRKTFLIGRCNLAVRIEALWYRD